MEEISKKKFEEIKKGSQKLFGKFEGVGDVLKIDEVKVFNKTMEIVGINYNLLSDVIKHIEKTKGLTLREKILVGIKANELLKNPITKIMRNSGDLDEYKF